MAEMKMKKKEWKTLSISVPLAEGVTAEFAEGTLKVNGPKGEVSKVFKYPNVTTEVKDGNIVISTKKLTQREKKIIFTFRAHAKNMVKGVTEGFEYKLVVLYAKFPMTVEVKNGVLTVKNLLGEKVPRTYNITEGVNVEVKGKDITVTGVDKELTGQVAASIEQVTRINHFDRRVIQDGIFITEKPHRRYV